MNNKMSIITSNVIERSLTMFIFERLWSFTDNHFFFTQMLLQNCSCKIAQSSRRFMEMTDNTGF